MQKIDTLRAALTAALPELATDPDRLKVWIERGAARSQQTVTRAFAFTFQLNVLVTELRTDIAVLALAVFEWLRVNQPSLLTPGADGFSFEADILDNDTADVLLQIQLEQCVTAAPREDGGYDLAYLAEPDPLFMDDLGAGDADPVPPLAGFDVIEDLPPWDA